MTLSIILPKDLEEELNREAAQLGLLVQDYVLRLLLHRPVLDTMPKTGTELVAYWQHAGLVGTHLQIEISEDYARLLRQEAEKRKSQ